MTDVYLGLNIPATFPLATSEKILVVVIEVYIVPIPATITPITHVTMLDCCVYLVLLIMFII